MSEELAIAKQIIGEQQIEIAQLRGALAILGGQVRDLQGSADDRKGETLETLGEVVGAAHQLPIEPTPIRPNRATRRRTAKAG